MILLWWAASVVAAIAASRAVVALVTGGRYVARYNVEILWVAYAIWVAACLAGLVV